MSEHKEQEAIRKEINILKREISKTGKTKRKHKRVRGIYVMEHCL